MKRVISHILLILSTFSCYCQSMTQNEVLDLVEILNNEATNNIQVTFTDNKAELKWHQETTVLSIKN